MRIGVFSDSHGFIGLAEKALDSLGKLDMILHAGDFYRDATALAVRAGVPVYAVVGNCDHRSDGPEDRMIEAGGKKIFLTHGHLYGAKTNVQRLLYKGLEEKADIVVFGHTHEAGYISQEGLLLFNPGSITCPRSGQKASCGLLEIKDEEITPNIFYL